MEVLCRGHSMVGDLHNHSYDWPSYIRVLSPPPRHVTGVAKLSVWDLRCIAELNFYSAIALTPSTTKVAGRPRVEPRFAPSDAMFIGYTPPHWISQCERRTS